MGNLLFAISSWSEVWALFIPLVFILRKNTIPAYLKPVRLYVFIALPINISAILIEVFKQRWGFVEGDFLWSNNFLYNTHSIVRLLLFSWFFILLKQSFMPRIKALIPAGFIIFVAINFIFYENFFPQKSFSSRLLSTEAALLLFYCLQYFIYLMIEDRSTRLSQQPGFWVITGLSIYVAVNFFIFLFYTYLSNVTTDFAVDLWDIHNIVFIILCIFLAKQFSQKNE